MYHRLHWFLLALAVFSGPIAVAESLTVVGFNVESGGAKLDVLASQIEGLKEPTPTPSDDAGVDAPNDAFSTCPDPDNPRVHYRSADPSDCIGIVLDCTTEQNGFQNTCGCGCIDKGDPICPTPEDPSITWMSMDPNECAPEPPECPPSEFSFSNSCGCRCVLPGGG